MPDDDWALGQNEVDVRNQARRERGYQPHVYGIDPEADWIHYHQIELCTNDHKCRAEPDEHDPGCPVEQQLKDELGF
jgi:hypothetical protein